MSSMVMVVVIRSLVTRADPLLFAVFHSLRPLGSRHLLVFKAFEKLVSGFFLGTGGLRTVPVGGNFGVLGSGHFLSAVQPRSLYFSVGHAMVSLPNVLANLAEATVFLQLLLDMGPRNFLPGHAFLELSTVFSPLGLVSGAKYLGTLLRFSRAVDVLSAGEESFFLRSSQTLVQSTENGTWVFGFADVFFSGPRDGGGQTKANERHEGQGVHDDHELGEN